MSGPNNMVPQIMTESNSQSAPVQPSATDPTTAAAAVSSNTNTANTQSSHFSSMEDLRRKNPKLYNLMMQGIAMNMISQMRRSQEHIAELWRKMREND
jgi:hypothetical protein